MYVWTMDNKIINLDHYPRIDILEWRTESGLNNYYVYAFSSSKVNYSAVIPEGDAIAGFTNRLDAKYTLGNLFTAITIKAGSWDAKSVEKLSNIWTDVLNHFYSDNAIGQILLKGVFISVTGFDEITITYSSQCHDVLNEISNCKKQIEQKLKERLHSIDIKWQPSDNIKLQMPSITSNE